MWSWKKNLRRQRLGIVLMVASKDWVSRMTPESSSQHDQKYGKLGEESEEGGLGDGTKNSGHGLAVVCTFPDLPQTVGAKRIELVVLKASLEFVLVPIQRILWCATVLVIIGELVS